MEYRISKRFAMESAITERTLMVGEAFGIALDDEQSFTVYDDFAIKVDQGDVVYITGDSGSGKSLLLRELLQRIPGALSTQELEIDPTAPIIDGVGRSIDEALYYLSLVGLNDAFLFLRKYGELSDGQKYRYQLAKLLESDSSAWFIDEFCALLDRETARVVAFNMQKIARRFGKTLVVATTHGDLLADLQPSVIVRKGLENEVAVEYRSPTAQASCSVVEGMRIVEGTLADYRTLARFHYRGHRMAGVQRVFSLKKGAEVVGVIVYVYPYLNLAGRNMVTDRYKAATSEVARRINEEVVMISRVVLHPKYRGIGLGAKLIRETMPLTGKRYVEALTVMGRFNPFNERAGLRRIEYQSKDRFQKVRHQLQLLGWNMALATSREYNLQKLQGLDEGAYRMVAAEVARLVRQGNEGCLRGVHKKDRQRPTQEGGESAPETVADLIKAVVPKAKAYLIWENPEWRRPESA